MDQNAVTESIVTLDPANPQGSALSIMKGMLPLFAAAISRYQGRDQAAEFWIAIAGALLGAMTTHIGYAAGQEVLRRVASVPEYPKARTH